jgi:hypothetical protein
MRYIIFVLLSVVCSSCSASSDTAENNKIVDDSSVVTNFQISLGNAGVKMMVSATNNKESMIYTSYMDHQNELNVLKGDVSGEYPLFRVFNYKGADARYTLIVPDYNADHNWYMLCPYHVRVYTGVECILSGKIDNYVFQTDIDDLTKFGQIVSAIKMQSRKYVRYTKGGGG